MPQFVALRASLGSSTASGGRHRDWPQALHRSAIRPLKDRPDRPQKMGPTSLPTPLSPMRGPALRQALSIQCFPSGAIRRLRIKGSVTGARTGIRCHPPVDPRRQRQVVRPSLPLRSGLRQAVPRSIPPSMAEASIGDSAIRVRRLFRYCLLGIRPGGPDP